MRHWLFFEEINDQLTTVTQIMYERADGGMSDGHQLLDAYRREGRTVHILELDVRMKKGVASHKSKWVKQSKLN